MTLKLSLKPETERRLREQAAAAGADVEQYAAKLVDWATGERASPDKPRKRKRLTDVFDRINALDPVQMPAHDVNYSRQELYEDHD